MVAKSGINAMAKKKIIAGFTLIELLVVIAIIGLLLAVVVPSMGKAKYYARRVICAGRMNQIGLAMKLYADANKEMLPTAYADDNTTVEMHSYVVYRADWLTNSRPTPLRFARLYETGFLDLPQTFYCPNNRDELFKFESYNNPSPWGTLTPNQEFNVRNGSNPWIRIGYTYNPVERTAKINPTLGIFPDPKKPVRKYTMMNLGLPYTTDILHKLPNLSHQYNSKFDEAGNALSWGTMAVNCLYGDGRVSTCTEMSVFKDKIWTNGSFDEGNIDAYQRAYLTIFKLIGP
jgi:prepilin-type N-terminal cleavage/methylation domain-containing protein